MTDDPRDEFAARRLSAELTRLTEADVPASAILSALVHVLVSTAERAGLTQAQLITTVATACGAQVEKP